MLVGMVAHSAALLDRLCFSTNGLAWTDMNSTPTADNLQPIFVVQQVRVAESLDGYLLKHASGRRRMFAGGALMPKMRELELGIFRHQRDPRAAYVAILLREGLGTRAVRRSDECLHLWAEFMDGLSNSR